MSTDIPRPPAASRRRRLLVAAGSALVVVALVVLGFVLGGDDEPAAAADAGAAATSSQPAPGTAAAPSADAPSGGAPETSAAAGTAAPPVTPAPTEPIEDVDELPPTLPPVPLDQQASVDDGMVAEVVSLVGIDGVGQGPGNISGPALRATVRLTNRTAGPVALDSVSVNLTRGADQTPAPPLNDPSTAPFTGELGPEQSAEGVYVFSVPKGDRDSVTLSVGYRAGAPFLAFTGPAR